MVTFGRIAAESGDVLAHPAQCGLLIGQAVVRLGAVGQRGMGQEAQRAEPVVDRDDDEVTRVASQREL